MQDCDFPKTERNKQYVQCPEQDCENLVYHWDQSLSMIEVLKLHDTDEWRDRVKAFSAWDRKSESKSQQKPWRWEGKDSQKWPRGSSKLAQSVPSSPAERENPIETPLAWYDVGEANIEVSYLYPDRGSDEACPVVKQRMMEKAEQQKYTQWIEKILNLDRRFTKDERLYCKYCDMNNHPRFSCKHFKKRRDSDAHHRCTLWHTHTLENVPRSNVQEHSAMVDARKAKLGSSRIQACKRGILHSRLSMGTRAASASTCN